MRRPGPTAFEDLPFHALLTDSGQAPERGGDYDCVHFTGISEEGLDAGGTSFSQCAFSEVSLASSRLRRSTLNEGWLRGVRAVATQFTDAGWLDVEVASSLFAGCDLSNAAWRRVTFHHCKLDAVNFRGAKLQEVRFVDCVLREVDFSGSVLTDVAFPGTKLERVLFHSVRARDLDFRGAEELGIASEITKLRGAVIDQLQLLELAEALARESGIEVRG